VNRVWRQAVLGEVLTLARDPVKVDAAATYPNLGIYSFGRGAFEKPPVDGDATSAETLYRVRRGQFIYSRLFAFEGAFALVPDTMDGYFVSNEYPTFDIDTDAASGEYLRIAICRPGTWREMASMTVGMGHRRQRLHPDAFLAYEMRLPPLDEQQRIVAAVQAADDVIATADLERGAALQLLAAARADALEPLETQRLGDLLAAIEAGKSPKAMDRPPQVGERGVLKVSAIRAGQFRPEESKAVDASAIFPDRARVRDGDVLISRANTRLLVGAACRVRGTFQNLFLCDKTLRLVPTPELDAGFLVHALAAPGVRAQIEEAASGTSDSMKNISQSIILDLDIPFVADLSEQQEITRHLDDLQTTATATGALRTRAAALREALAESLLAAEHEILAA
jgi:type I restriction enzyme, S subunit